MRFVGKYLDEISASELCDCVIKRLDDRLSASDRELVIRERRIGDVTELTVSRVLTEPIN